MNGVVRFGDLLWNHKKKTVASIIAAYFAQDYVRDWKSNCDIRKAYAERASKFGAMPISALLRTRRVSVLVNRRAGTSDRSYNNFKMYALPLLHYAGLQVDMIEAKDKAQLESVALVLDSTDADALYIVGGDGTVSDVLTAIYGSGKNPSLPIGIFPGGKENRSLLHISPNIFANQEDVRRYCESAMAVIEKKTKIVPAIGFFEEKECSTEPSSAKVRYGLSDLHTGWYDYVEKRKEKLWYWGSLKRKVAYLLENLKRSPSDLAVALTYSDMLCESINHRQLNNAIKSKWLLSFFGMKKTINECVLRIRSSPGRGRFEMVKEGWLRCNAKALSTSPSPNFYETDVSAKSVSLAFQAHPEHITTFKVFGDAVEIAKERIYHFCVTSQLVTILAPDEFSCNP